jgi:hypothetical protein
MVCLRNISIDTLHTGDTEDDDDNDNNNNNNNNFTVIFTIILCPWLLRRGVSPFIISCEPVFLSDDG